MKERKNKQVSEGDINEGKVLVKSCVHTIGERLVVFKGFRRLRDYTIYILLVKVIIMF